MKKEPTVFTPEMLNKNNFGLYIIRAYDSNIKENVSYASTVSYKLGYINHRLVESKKRYGLISFLTDGWFLPVAENDQDICDYLNNLPEGQKFRLLTKEEVIYMIKHRTQGFLED
jgi:hypothetical protein